MSSIPPSSRQISASTSPQVFFAENVSRDIIEITVESGGDVFLKCGTGAVPSSTNYDYKIPAYVIWRRQFKYTGPVNGVSSATDGVINLTEESA